MSTLAPSFLEEAKSIMEDLKDTSLNDRPQRENTIIYGTDIDTDIDDKSLLCAYVLLHKWGVIDLKLVVTNRELDKQRAKIAKSTLKKLNASNILVAYGTEGAGKDKPFHSAEPDDTIPQGESAVIEVLTGLKEKEERCNILVVSSHLDLSLLIDKHPDLIRQTVSSISMQGAWRGNPNSPQPRTLDPDMEATNNSWDPKATSSNHEWFKGETITTFTATRASARKATVHPGHIKQHATEGNQVARELYNDWRQKGEQYFNDAQQEDPKRRFKEDKDLKWLIQGVPRWREANGDTLPESYKELLPYLDMVLYDLIAGLINPLRKYDFFSQLFQPHQQTLRVEEVDVHHYIVGKSSEEPNVDPGLLSAFMGQLLHEAFTM
jgi:inosine-uridine nucleoside N-ribohydrolase